jgi:hypothetical protein
MDDYENFEEELKTSLMNLAEDNVKLCRDLLALNATSVIIAENLLGCTEDNIDEFVDRFTVNNERLRLGIGQLQKLDLDVNSKNKLYYFSMENGLIETTPMRLMLINSVYAGEDIVTDIEQVIPELLLLLLYDVVKSLDLAASKRINEAITLVLELLDKQKENSK